ncbi:hypothetical protein FALBO_15894 [Fusarium albosuccineum]|uniref:Uncharacterized protein n=1 Tax=Fusarium albosuccineum TaxID=1237068 RepID=A0A8H4KQU8_9HYPO|nr:hypothetical protein FALBO_15894 [Fusarium albosuccineum]
MFLPISPPLTKAMTRGEYGRIGSMRIFQQHEKIKRDKSNSQVKAWKKIKEKVLRPLVPSNQYAPLPSNESVHMASNQAVGSFTSPAEQGVMEEHNQHYPREGSRKRRISIHLTHNHPCHEDGEDDDHRCLWLNSSDDDDDDGGMLDSGLHGDAVSVSSWPKSNQFQPHSSR